jgi:hypothetical protein
MPAAVGGTPPGMAVRRQAALKRCQARPVEGSIDEYGGFTASSIATKKPYIFAYKYILLMV